MSESANSPTCVLVDGQCPICALYARHVTASADPASTRMIDGRVASAEKQQAQIAGYDIDQGMVVITPAGLLAGREAMIHLSRTLDPGASWLLGFCARVFRHRVPAAIAYPVFKAVRRAALWAKGVGPLR